ncbi:hypothetical protein FBU59_001541 [Linderina macrospora]|uniref:Uncharacterized protein n=1 Tax=Linderina macrospora TaxID=4868 RepID=A0ACC1JDJ4_9FUNG|nr:hypothetical protein FBU59_001541 [Linderina macrospora]
MDTYLEYRRQRLEWMVISAAAIMVPTVGGSALVSVYRIFGTCAGGLAAFFVYEVGKDTPALAYALLVLFSIPCFHIMLNGKYPKIGQFALITFGVILINKWVAREDQTESAFSLAMRRTLSVAFGVLAGMLVTMYVWPYEARVRVRQALSWWLQTGSMLYDQLWNSLWLSYATPAQNAATAHSAALTDRVQPMSEPAEWHALTTVRDYLDNELQLQDSLMEIRILLDDTQNEPRLKGPFPIDAYKRILNACQRILDAMVAARWVMLPVPMVVASRLDQFPPLPPVAVGRPATADTVQKTDTFRRNEFEVSMYPELVVDATELAPIERLSAANIKSQLDNCRQHRRHSSSESDTSNNQYSTFPAARRSQSGLSHSSSASSAGSVTDSSVLESGNTTEEEEGRILLDLPIGMASTVMLEREQLELDRLVVNSQHPTPHSPRLQPQSASNGATGCPPDDYDSDDDDDDDIHNSRYMRERYEGEISQRISKIVEADLLRRTAAVREQRDALVALTMYVLASALILKTPLPAILPPIHAAQRRVAEALSDILDPTATAVSHIAGLDSVSSDDGDDQNGEQEQIVLRAVARIRYVFYYTQVMLGWEMVQELNIVGSLMRELYGSYGTAPSALPR